MLLFMWEKNQVGESEFFSELGYGATRSTDDLCAMDHFSVFEVQWLI
jgi:hypothetical protein